MCGIFWVWCVGNALVNALKNIAANGTFSVAYLPKLLQMPLRFYLHYLKCTFHNISSKGGMLCLPLGGIEYLRMAFVRQTLRAGKKRRCVVVKSWSCVQHVLAWLAIKQVKMNPCLTDYYYFAVTTTYNTLPKRYDYIGCTVCEHAPTCRHLM